MDIAPEREIKHERVRAYLSDHGLDGVLLSRRCNFSWYTCGAHNYVAGACDAGNSWLFVDADGAVVLTSNIEAPRLGGEELAGAPIEVREFAWADASDRLAAFERLLGAGRVAADAPPPRHELPPLEEDFAPLRWPLTDSEIARYRALTTDVNGAVETAARAARPGQTEHQLAGRLAAELRTRGCEPWVLLVAADERVECFRHPLATDTPAERYFMLVTCAERGGLIAASTRLASFVDVPGALADRHRAVATVDAALIGATRPGAKLGELFDVARRAYDAVGFADEWRNHHQGGSIGYLPREVKAGPGETTRVRVDQAFAWNPSIAGTKCEDTVLAGESGGELLAAPTDWPTVEAEWEGFRILRPDILRL